MKGLKPQRTTHPWLKKMDKIPAQAYLYGVYATRIYLPFSSAARSWQRVIKNLLGKKKQFLQNASLPKISWKKCTRRHLAGIWEYHQENGNVRVSELGILSACAADCRNHSNLFEIGTFDGRTTLNLAMSSPRNCVVYTLDLPSDREPVYALAPGERHMVDKPKPGSRYEKNRESHPDAVNKIHQLLGDSAVFDFSAYAKSCSLVFVDGSHSYETVKSDSHAAMEMVEPGGTVLWHDYGIWEGVTTALDEMAFHDGMSLFNIRGTSLAYWKKDKL